ncbi:MAG: hypothetical protein LE169_02785 [Endomicrobium sp.]|nr:hypothetical protein [Endomicrobium sp.]
MYKKEHVEATKKYIHWEVTRDYDDDSDNGRSSGEADKNKADEKEKRVTFYDGKEWS